MEFRIARYSMADKAVWDAFVAQSRNGSFLFLRDYMDYHSDRFADCSLMVYRSDEERLVAVLPANQSGKELFSHGGLTYGGLVTGFDITATQILEIFETIVRYGRDNGFEALHYKPIPTIYHKCPAQDDEYALWRCGAVLESCNLASVADLSCAKTPMVKSKTFSCRQLLRRGYSVCSDTPLESYWPLLESHLKERFNVKPVHSVQEICLLQSRFPEIIKCITVHDPQGLMLGGVVVFVQDSVMHLQYSCSSENGMKSGAMTLLYEWLLDFSRSNGFRYFDMGTSNEEHGQILNPSLEFWKWSFGGRGVTYKTYLLKF